MRAHTYLAYKHRGDARDDLFARHHCVCVRAALSRAQTPLTLKARRASPAGSPDYLALKFFVANSRSRAIPRDSKDGIHCPLYTQRQYTVYG